MTLQDLEGKTALVTGGARGIGLAITRSLAAAGMTVVVADQDEAVAKEAIAELADPRLSAVALDVRSPEQWESVVSQVWDTTGGIDLLCNNAGIGVAAAPGQNPFRSWEVPLEKFRQVIDVNLIGTLLGLRTVVPRMIQRGEQSHIVNTASMAGFLAPPYLSAYSSSKFAVVALSESAAAELEPHDIGISILCPGGVATAFNESARRLGTAKATPSRPTGPAATDAMKMDPASVGERVVRAITGGELYVFTHPEYEPLVNERQASVTAAFGESAQPSYRDPQNLLDRSRNPIHARGKDQV